jgi:hypothetical protein
MGKFISSSFKLARKAKGFKAVNSGDSKKKVARRLKNKIIGRRLIRKIL